MLKAFVNIFKIPDLKKKVLVTLALLAIYRIGCYVPTPGINTQALAGLMEEISRGVGGALFGLIDMFSGGAMSQMTIFALGIMPYISASIIMQLLTSVVPALEKLAKEGESGRKKITQYTRYGTVVLSLIQSFGISTMLMNPEMLHPAFKGVVIVSVPGWGFRLMTMLTMTAAVTFIMWLGEQITERGIGNGISLIITANIISRMPTAARQLSAMIRLKQIDFLTLIFMAAMLIFVIVGVILITQGQRKIPVQYAKRIIGRKVYSGQATYIPLRVNLAGVIPIIFAQSVLMFPAMLTRWVPMLQGFSALLDRGGFLYNLFYAILIIFFCYFYTAITFNPVDVADNMKKYGGFVPGVRPGKSTAEHFFYIMNRLTLAGALFLAVIAITPTLVYIGLKIPYSVAAFFGGTGLLIIVGVMLDTMKQIESHLVMRHYDGFMKKAKMRGRR